MYVFNSCEFEAYFKPGVNFIAAFYYPCNGVVFFSGGLSYDLPQTLPGLFQQQQNKVTAAWGQLHVESEVLHIAHPSAKAQKFLFLNFA